ncbi:phosphonate transporter [Rubrivivax gelatinosus]|uniref:Phosphonate transporter n=1 Tax=Rubrivivax gelatinosus TaxID=28068 RepID=A0ABS1DXB2_RUBGE|nr:phosphonate transporter [Rubrivivax gelatinosus]MBK1615164.1 phosphonate transporter [Rubrivivax gelatinosus]MBK1713761.1 phosphonate transporter [Rubrivivax gelatinosus]
MSQPPLPGFDADGLIFRLEQLDSAALDALDFGVIGFDADGFVRCYNLHESRHASLPVDKVVGHHLFTDIALCMNNYLVAQRFEDAAAAGLALDATIDYVLTWRMRPTRVRLRLLSQPDARLRYIALQRPG